MSLIQNVSQFHISYLSPALLSVNKSNKRKKTNTDNAFIICFSNDMQICLGELHHALSLSKPKLVFVSPSAAKPTVAACKQLKFVRNVVVIEGKVSDKFVISLSGLIKKYEKLTFNIEDHVCGEVDISDQTALIICSSGTTGLPKGVLITQENMMACLQTSRGGMELLKSSHNGSIVAFNIAPWYGKKLSYVA